MNEVARIQQAVFAALYSPFVVLLLVLMASCSRHDEARHDTYTCPMHPTVISDRPGTCPVCGMDLVRKARPGEEMEITEDVSRLLRSPNEAVVASVRTIRGEYKAVPVHAEATGVVTYDPRKIYNLPARVGGRLEKVFLKYDLQPVRKGQKVAEIYSPELVTAQRELLFLLENDPENKGLIKAARSKLKLLGLTDGQIEQLAASRTQQTTFALFSPYSGYVVTSASTPGIPVTSVPSGPSDGMGSMGSQERSAAPMANPAPQASAGADALPREGTYVTPGQMLFRIVNTSDLRIELDLAKTNSGLIHKGDTVELTFGSGKSQSAVVDLVQPFFTEGENFVKLRIYTNQTEHLRIGQLVTAKILLKPQESLWVPAGAVVDLGTQKVVFLKDRTVLRPKPVTTGLSANGMVEITSGLASADEIAENAQFLVDSESFIKTAN